MSEQLIKGALDAHNKWRAKHGAPPLVHNPALTQIAQNWSNNQAARNSMYHSGNKFNGQHMGENCACGSGNYLGNSDYEIGQKATQMWYDEIQYYNFGNPGFSGSTGHFTQVVWKESKEFGIGFAKSSSGWTYVTANYFPAGNMNMRGEFQRNVLPFNTPPPQPPQPAKPAETSQETANKENSSVSIFNKHGYLNGGPNHISSTGYRKWRLIYPDGSGNPFFLQCEGNGHFLDGGGNHMWRYDSSSNPNPDYIKWTFVPWNNGFLVKNVATGHFLDAGENHMWPNSAESNPNPDYITWQKE